MIRADQKIPFAHYLDERYTNGDVTVYGSARDDLFYNYDDRLMSHGNHSAATAVANASSAAKNTPAWWIVYLKAIHGATRLDLRHIMTGVNKGNGFQYLVLGYTYDEAGS